MGSGCVSTTREEAKRHASAVAGRMFTRGTALGCGCGPTWLVARPLEVEVGECQPDTLIGRRMDREPCPAGGSAQTKRTLGPWGRVLTLTTGALNHGEIGRESPLDQKLYDRIDHRTCMKGLHPTGGTSLARQRQAAEAGRGT